MDTQRGYSFTYAEVEQILRDNGKQGSDEDSARAMRDVEREKDPM